MITDDTDFLPLAAAPYFVRLVSFFNQSLEDAIDLFQINQDDQTFAKVLDYFVNDYDYYRANYTYWQQEAKTEQDRVSLQVLDPLLEESSRLVSHAVGLIGH